VENSFEEVEEEEIATPTTGATVALNSSSALEAGENESPFSFTIS
jgi:hypothetical protein